SALALETIVGALVVIAICVAGWWLVRPPEFAKPGWLRDEEAAAHSGLQVADHRPPRPSPAVYAAGWAVNIALVVVWLVLGLPLPILLMFVGVGVSLLLANPPRRGDSGAVAALRPTFQT